MSIKVGIVGYGTIGKRVAWAVSLQPDMKVAGIVKTRPNWEVLSAVKRGFKIYVPEGSREKFIKYGIPVEGGVKDLLNDVDIVVDATPAGVGERNKPLYKSQGIKAVFQGGESAELCEVSFNSLVNYNEAYNKDCVRVVSCNTTGLIRIIHGISKLGKVKKVRAIIVRRGADLKEVKKGPIEGLLLKPTTPPSHHAHDVKTVIKDLEDIITYSIVAPTTLAHMHIVNITLEPEVSKDDVIEALKSTPRVILIDGAMLSSTAELREFAKEYLRPGGDIYENVVWEDSIWAEGHEVMLAYAVHQEAIVVPENIDAVRSLAGLLSKNESIELTNKTLGIKNMGE
jgi:glyceraldehyde-3-phosphate dehydrogenase (NAD(P))